MDNTPPRYTRLDQALVDMNAFASRARAQAAIAAGLVKVDGAVAVKSSQKVLSGADIQIDGDVHPFVSRGGVKLDDALRSMEIDPAGKVCLDLGASTGGFSDVLLSRGAAKIYAVDVGRGQLHDKIASDPRVVNLEKTHAKDLSAALILDAIDIIVCDVSFISLKKALPPALALAAPGARLVALIKPQFEVGRTQLGKGGVVKPGYKNTYGVCEDITSWIDQQAGWKSSGYMESPIKGGDGNQELRIETIGARGDGVADFNGAQVYVPYTASGDVVEASLSGNRGMIETLLEKSAHRVNAPCMHFGQCGGCALQHLDDVYYRTWKRRLVVNALTRQGFDEAVVAPLVSCTPESRRRARFAIRKTAAGLVFGFNKRSSDRIVDIERCLIIDPALQQKMDGLRRLAAATPHHWRVFDMAVSLCDNGVDVTFSGGDAEDSLSVQEASLMTTAAETADVIRVSIEDVALRMRGVLQIFFSGVGTFTLPLATGAPVDAVDSDKAAIGALDAALRRQRPPHPVTAKARNLFDRPLMASELREYDCIVFDPPRAGAEAQAVEIAASSTPLVIGVSCNPVSFARDAAILRSGGYALSQVTPVDQFVYAPHVELVGIFTKG
ncbi:Uncharacterized RNA methyltransferase BMEI1496 [Durusdinium trenchii]|uniref:Uncharacterized RNA methyltransferase BMEI1496 n=1 Tax=Durusdinium trenchii TaxID=1381693 RepID=A0ABP0LVE9_9DINO